MEADVFISHSTKDKPIADAACAVLERNGIRCWIAPRDIPPGASWSGEIMDAIERCRVMVLIVSENANSSPHIEREVEGAIGLGRPIIPVRVQDIEPSKALNYFISVSHWLDAFTPPMEQHFEKLADAVRGLLNKDAPPRPGAVAPPPAAVQPRSRTPLLAGAGVLSLAAAGVAGWLLWPRPEKPKAAPPPPAAEAKLVIDDIPFLRDFDRASLRADYPGAPDHKAIAVSFVRAIFVSGKSSEDAARTEALSRCQAVSDMVGRGNLCRLYAVGEKVVWTAGRPPMPPPPWLRDDAAVTRPFAPEDMILNDEQAARRLDDYLDARGVKAIAMAPNGQWRYRYAGASVDEASRRALEVCGFLASQPCMVIVVDDKFVAPVPHSMKAVSFFRVEDDALIAPAARGDVARRLAAAASGWSAVAAGASGNAGVSVRADSEDKAIDQALAECKKVDRDCTVIAIGPFKVSARKPAN